MAEDPAGNQRIVPYLAYADAAAAIIFLREAFGFEELMRYPMDDGRVGHAELSYQGHQIWLSDVFEGFGESPLRLPAVHGQLYCRVDDVDAHFERARAAGATIVAEPKNEHGMRSYRALDPEGHRWVFMTPAPGAS